jgi:hypothetical protein
MLREPKQIEKTARPFSCARKRHFRVVKLEERIAPCTTNPAGHETGNCTKHGGGNKRIGL